MTDSLVPANKISVGDEFHILGQALMLKVSNSYDGTRIFEPGSTLVLTEEMVALAAEVRSWAGIVVRG